MERTQRILAKQPLIGRAVKTFLRKNPTFGYLKDDLRSEAQIALIKAIDHGHDDDSHIVRSILSHLSATIDLEANAIRIPASTRREAKRNGNELEPIKCESLSEYHTDTLVDPRSHSITDVLECCKDAREREIVRMRAAGFKKLEIANTFGVHPGRITHILKQIEKRYGSDDDLSSDEPYIKVPQGTATHCRCGQPIEHRFCNEGRCEDCFAIDSQRFDGKSRRVNVRVA